MRDGSSARSFAKLAVGMLVNRGALALVALLPAPLLHAATASIEGNVVQVLATGDGRFGGCMAALDVDLADVGLDCSGSWVTFSCTGEHAEKEDAHRMFESLRAAVVADKSVEMRVTDEKKHGQYCYASRIKIQDEPDVDEDSDGDGVLDLDDDVPLDASETVDTDDDGVGNNADTDDDNDGVSDADDAFPLDANESVDTDGDGVGDNEDTDDDNDGVLDVDDPCRLDRDDNCEVATFAPPDMAAFDARFVGNRVTTDDPANYVDFVSAGRFRETSGTETYEGSYTYTNTGEDTGMVVFEYDDGDECTSSLTFSSRTAGVLSYTCDDGDSGSTSWRLVDYEPVDPAGPSTCEVSLGRSSSAGGAETVTVTLSSARDASVGTSNVPASLDARMDDASDFDAYEIALNTAGRLTVLSESSLDMQALFLADDCTEVGGVGVVEDVGRLSGIPSNNLNFAAIGDVTDGTYYLVVFEWAGRTGDYSLELLFDDPLVNDAPVIRDIPDQEIAPGDTATVLPNVRDDRGDTHTVSAESNNVGIATVAVTRTAGGDPALAIAAVAQGTATISVAATDQHGASATVVVFEVVVRSPTLVAPTVGPGGGAGELEVAFTATFGPRETRAYDYQVRRKRPQSPWASACVRWTNRGASELTTLARRTFTGLAAGVMFEVRYRDRGSSSCADGTPGHWSAVGEGHSRAQASVFELDAANGSPVGIAHANDVLYVVDGTDDKMYAYTTSGTRDADSDFDLDSANGSPSGVAFANDRFRVVDSTDDKVYAYRLSGERDAASDFDLAAVNGSPRGIAATDDGLRVVDWVDETVYAYRLSGERDPEADFDLAAPNRFPEGIARASGLLYVVDSLVDKVYAYGMSGERKADSEFDLDSSNGSPKGMTYASASFYVVDSATDRIFVYAEDGGAAAARLSFPEGIATSRAIQENIPAGINVGAPVSADGNEGLVYTLDGPDVGSFDLLPATGQIRTKDGVAYDYETKDRYVVEVGAADDDGNRASIDVTIHIVDLVPSCGSQDELNLRTNHSDGRLTLRWDPLAAIAEHAPVQGYETEIRRGDTGAWTDRRTFLGRNITGAVYGDLDNEVGYQVRVRPLNAEGDCEWSTPVSGIPTADRAPRDDDEYHDRFGPHPVGTPERNFRLLTPGRCRHTLDGVNLDADCTYERTGPHAGRITLEFDDPSRGSCDVVLAYSSLTAGSFIDECFDAGVNTNVSFDRSFRMPPLADQDDEVEVPRAPRSQEEFDVLAWGRDDFIPGLGFACAPVFDTCNFTPGRGYTVGRDADTGLPDYVLGDYTYMNTGPSTGVLTFRDHFGSSYTFTLDFGGSGGMRATVEATGGGASVWPGIPHLDLTLGAQPVLLPIPPSWSAALALEADFAPEPANASRVRGKLLQRFFPDYVGSLLAGEGGLQYRLDYLRLGRNRAIQTVEFPWRDPKLIYGRDEAETARRLALNGSTWSFVLTFTSDGAARFTLTGTKEGHLPTVVEGVVDFHGDGISVDEFPEELLLPDDPPQASGEDVSGVEVAAAITTTRIGANDLQTILVSASGADHQPGDWLEPKDGSNQRMMIVGAGQGASALAFEAPAPPLGRNDPQSPRVKISMADQPGNGLQRRDGTNQWTTLIGVGEYLSVADMIASTDVSSRPDGNLQKTRTAFPPGQSSALAAAVVLHSSTDRRVAASSSAFTQLTVVCMQVRQGIPTRGARYFSRAKAAEGEVQLCQKDCVLNETSNIQGCVWGCEASSEGD